MQPWQPGRHPSVRASDADRERTADVLKAGYAEGRLGKAEYDQRLDRAHRALTQADLQLLIADLPQGSGAAPLPYAVPPPAPSTNGKAVGSFVCGLLALPTCGVASIPAVVLGHHARREIRTSGEQGDGLAVTGLTLGWVFVTLALVAWLTAIF